MPDIYDKRLTQKEVDRLMAPMELDLIALFKQLQEDVIDLIDRAQKNNWTPDELIEKITGLLEE